MLFAASLPRSRQEPVHVDLFQEMGQDLPLRLPLGNHPLLAHQAPVLFFLGAAHHFVQVQLQDQLGFLPIPPAETPDGGFVDAQRVSDPGGGPPLFETPEDEAPLLGSKAVVALG